VVRTEFDEAYYRRFYRDPEHRVGTKADTARVVALVAAYLAHLQVPIKSVLDLGCGLGWWRDPVRRHFAGARWVGVERSQYLCERFGWAHGSVVDWKGPPADLVVCQGVLQYLSERDARRALRNLTRLARRALYVEVVTREDWERTLDRRRSDRQIALRPADFYRRALDRCFIACGAGLYVRKGEATLFELERGARAGTRAGYGVGSRSSSNHSPCRTPMRVRP
jgi:SAM-dependent methyltransferase